MENKGYPLKVALKEALSRRLSKKLSLLLPDKYFLVNYLGAKIYLNLKESPMMRNKALSIYEYWKTKLFLDIVKEGMTIVDVGANKGYFSLLFAKLMNDKGKVLSFEPDPNNCFWIGKSIQANKYRSIKVYQLALSDKEGEAAFYPGKKSGWGSLFFAPDATFKESITVRTRKLDNILNEQGIDDLNIVKIDVEGAELLALEGAKNILKRAKNLQLCMDIDVKSVKEKEQLFEFLNSCGFAIYNIGKELKPIKKIEQAGKDIYAAKHEGAEER